jgi:plastocyanin
MESFLYGGQFMKKVTVLFSRSALWKIAALTILLNASIAPAANHVISFGGTIGLNYSPDQLNVSVGDSITWQGSFSAHPLSSISVPAGAASFQKSTGSTFTYPVQVAGNYTYECDIHASSGMNGSFNALVTDIREQESLQKPSAFRLSQNYPNPFNAETQIQFDLASTQRISLKIYALTGAEIATLVDGSLPAGRFKVYFDAGNLASGIYFYRLISDHIVATKRMILAK